jgi:hypothetical protein
VAGGRRRRGGSSIVSPASRAHRRSVNSCSRLQHLEVWANPGVANVLALTHLPFLERVISHGSLPRTEVEEFRRLRPGVAIDGGHVSRRHPSIGRPHRLHLCRPHVTAHEAGPQVPVPTWV